MLKGKSLGLNAEVSVGDVFVIGEHLSFGEYLESSVVIIVNAGNQNVFNNSIFGFILEQQKGLTYNDVVKGVHKLSDVYKLKSNEESLSIINKSCITRKLGTYDDESMMIINSIFEVTLQKMRETVASHYHKRGA